MPARSREQTELSRLFDCLAPAMDAELRVEVTHMRPDRIDGDEQLASNLLSLQVGRKVAEDAELRLGEVVDEVGVACGRLRRCPSSREDHSLRDQRCVRGSRPPVTLE